MVHINFVIIVSFDFCQWPWHLESLALALGPKSLALALALWPLSLALDPKSLALALWPLFLALDPKSLALALALWPLSLALHFLFSIRSITFNPGAKFEVCIFSRSRDIRGSQNLKSRSRDLGHAPFCPIFHFCSLLASLLLLAKCHHWVDERDRGWSWRVWNVKLSVCRSWRVTACGKTTW